VWRTVIPDLVATHRVIAPDLPGHGATDAIVGEVAPGRIFGWLGDLIECTCSAPPDFGTASRPHASARRSWR
jgi:pimeloyl-ACP methyl ester carboxylesterase